MMSIEDLDEWDSTFLEQVIGAEEQLVVSISTSSSKNPTTITVPSPPILQSYRSSLVYNNNSNFSPPRELSLSQNPNSTTQCLRPPPHSNGSATAAVTFHHHQQVLQFDRLKQKDCAEELNKKQEERQHVDHTHNNNNEAHMEQVAALQERLQISHQFQNASTSIPQAVPEYTVFETKDNHRTSGARGSLERLSGGGIALEKPEYPSADHQLHGSYGLKGGNVQLDGISITTDLRRRTLIDNALTTSNECSIQKIVVPETMALPKCTSEVGVQTDTDDACGYSTANNDLHSQHDLLNKFSAIWGLTRSQREGRGLLSTLFVTCAADFYALFRCMGMSMPSTLESMADFCIPNVILHDKLQHVHSVEASKVAHLYFILTKINNEMMQLDILIDALMELCTLDNVVVVHRSLRIVRVLLQHVLGWHARSDRRDNVAIEGMHHRNNTVEMCKSRKLHSGVQFGVTRNRTSFLGNDASSIGSFDLDFLCDDEHREREYVASVSAIDWLSLFEMIHRIAAGIKEECIQVEALSVMNLILMRSSPCIEREKFGSRLMFESLSKLLQKDVGLQVQKQAVHLLFLLLNCSKILLLFCSGCKDEANSGAAAVITKDVLTFREFSTILEGLAECVKSRGHGTQELKLRILSIKVLAFVASSGKSGIEVLLNQNIPKGGNFLELIMQALASEMDSDTAESNEPSETCKERTSLIREALILLNRLASSPAYSGAVLQVLTSSRDTMSLTIHVVNRMSRKVTGWWKSDSTKKRKAEDEIIDLARVFRSRVLGYLGNT